MIQIVVSDCDASFAIHMGGDIERTARVFKIEAPELEAYLREHRDAQSEAAFKKQYIYWTRQVISVEPLSGDKQ